MEDSWLWPWRCYQSCQTNIKNEHGEDKDGKLKQVDGHCRTGVGRQPRQTGGGHGCRKLHGSMFEREALAFERWLPQHWRAKQIDIKEVGAGRLG